MGSKHKIKIILPYQISQIKNGAIPLVDLSTKDSPLTIYSTFYALIQSPFYYSSYSVFRREMITLPLSKEVSISQVFPRLTIFSEENFRGSSRILRGNLGIRNTDSILDGIESLRFFSTSSNATLVLFTRTRFRGNFRVLRGNHNIADLDDFISGQDVESLISTNQRLTLTQIRNIRDRGTLPSGYSTF